MMLRPGTEPRSRLALGQHDGWRCKRAGDGDALAPSRQWRIGCRDL